MMHLAPKVFLTEIGSRAVVLDLGRDKYLALSPTLAAAARSRTAALADVQASQAAVAKLLAEGILSSNPRSAWDRRAETLPPAAAHTLWPTEAEGAAGPAPIAPAAFWSVQRALFEAASSLRWRSFAATLAWLAGQPSAPGGARRSVQALLDDYAAARPWFPVRPVCRLEALALALYLRRRGCAAAVVFGVKLEPFAAHCWVQVGATVLNESHDGVAHFSPILAI